MLIFKCFYSHTYVIYMRKFKNTRKTDHGNVRRDIPRKKGAFNRMAGTLGVGALLGVGLIPSVPNAEEARPGAVGLTPEHQEKANKMFLDAVRKGDLKLVGALLEGGADVNARGEKGWTALMRAAVNGHVDVVKILIEKGADVNLQKDSGETAIMCVAFNGNEEITKILFNNGAKVNIKNKNKVTPLMVAAKKGNVRMVEIFIENKADVNAKDHLGRTALDHAEKEGNAKIVEILKKAGAKDE